MCSQREAEPIAMSFLPDGFNVFTLTYSVLPHHYPAQLQEVAALIELIYNNSDEWNCDTDKIAIIGFSAGGHLAAHYSTSYASDAVREVFPDSKPVHASVLGYPVISALPQYRHEHSIKCVSGHETITDEDVEKFSLENRVSGKTPPAFIWHTAEDDCVPVMNSILYAQALAKQNIRFAMHIYPFGYHGLSTADGVSCWPLDENQSAVHQWLGDLKHWLKSTLGEE